MTSKIATVVSPGVVQLKNRRIAAQLVAGIFLTALTLTLTACKVLYRVPEFNFAGRPIPPSQMLQRVLATYTNGGTSGGAQLLDGLRDLRGNIQNTKPVFPISGFSAPEPTTILNFPEQTRGYVLSQTAGTLIAINYSTEASIGPAASFAPEPASVGAAFDGSLFAAASSLNSQIYVTNGGATYALNLPNVYRVAVNQGVTVILAMVRNSNALYRVIKLPASANPVVPPGAIDCEPQLLPVYCVVPVAGTYDRPINASFSLDGNSVYVLNCGPECGGTTAGISVLQTGSLLIDNIPAVNPLSPSAPSPFASIGVPNPVPIPGGATVALSNGTTLYLAGQSLYSLGAGGTLGSSPRADGLFTGYLTAVNLSNYSVSAPISISDGTHTKLLFADDNTLWAGSQQCASGERAAKGQNYNCLTMITLGAGSGPIGTAQVIPNVTPGGSTTVAYPNTNQNPYYYGDLTGICWVQNYHKVFTAYGGQIHVFYTGGA
ncbi:MAG TPA: hypothetical protein VN734_16395, partial [Acidobacteriaceae bacterium]|nr:hypothetical protein [Acidobacteriaceae bacterium]